MTIELSPQIRLVAILGGVAALGLAAFMLTLGRASSSSHAQALVTPPVHHTHTVARPAPAHPAAKAKVRAKPKVVPAPARTKPKPKPPARKLAVPPVTLLPGLPPGLAGSLERHEVAVVALFDPQARVDRISLAEASAGAAVAHVGFVPLDVLDQREAGPLTRLLGVLPDPAVLVYRRPGNLVARFDGFADRDTVAQAVLNALPAELVRRAERPAPPTIGRPAHVTLPAWAGRASTACSRFVAGTHRIGKDASRAEFLDWAPTALGSERELLAKLTALPLPTSPHARLLGRRLVAAVTRLYAQEQLVYEAVKRDDMPAAHRLLAADGATLARTNTAARAAGATGCVGLDR